MKIYLSGRCFYFYFIFVKFIISFFRSPAAGNFTSIPVAYCREISVIWVTYWELDENHNFRDAPVGLFDSADDIIIYLRSINGSRSCRAPADRHRSTNVEWKSRWLYKAMIKLLSSRFPMPNARLTLFHRPIRTEPELSPPRSPPDDKFAYDQSYFCFRFFANLLEHRLNIFGIGFGFADDDRGERSLAPK